MSALPLTPDAAPADEVIARIELVPLVQETRMFRITGVAPLLVHQWSEKSRRQLLEGTRVKKALEPRRPGAEIADEAIYRFHGQPDDVHGFPAAGVKKAIVSAARFFKGALTMAELKSLIYIHQTGECREDGQGLLEIEHDSWKVDTRMVRIGGRASDVRYRPRYDQWSIVAPITFFPHIIDLSSLCSLVEAAGFVGLGENRPERGGTNGRFRLDATIE